MSIYFVVIVGDRFESLHKFIVKLLTIMCKKWYNKRVEKRKIKHLKNVERMR